MLASQTAALCRPVKVLPVPKGEAGRALLVKALRQERRRNRRRLAAMLAE